MIVTEEEKYEFEQELRRDPDEEREFKIHRRLRQARRAESGIDSWDDVNRAQASFGTFTGD